MSTLLRHIPIPIKRFARMCIYSMLDGFDAITGRRPPMMPPRMSALTNGAGDFIKIGEEFRDYFIKYGGLMPTHKVLEIGTGYGRMAVGLTGYLDAQGSYDGIEIIKKAVDWCASEISSRFPNFRFHHADLHNNFSNKEGKNQTSSYHVPFPESHFDFVFLTGVFGHLLPQNAEAYLAEIHRVLKPGGRCFITWYLLDEFAREQIRTKKSHQPFGHDFGDFLSVSAKSPENALAYPVATVREYYVRHGLVIDEPLLFGEWSGRENSLTWQDVVNAHKPL
jgi:SAM-dependent methyltransferase